MALKFLPALSNKASIKIRGFFAQLKDETQLHTFLITTTNDEELDSGCSSKAVRIHP